MLTGWLSLPQQGPSTTLLCVRLNGDSVTGMWRSGPMRVLALAYFDGQVFADHRTCSPSDVSWRFSVTQIDWARMAIRQFGVSDGVGLTGTDHGVGSGNSL